MNPFEFVTTPRVVFGPGRLADAGAIVRDFGSRALVVSGRSPERADMLVRLLAAAGVESEVLSVHGEPSIETGITGAALARRMNADVVVAIGGGSALDTGKAVAALATNHDDVFEYLETIGRARPLDRAALSVVAIPTTAGTGSEATRNAVLASPEHRVKVSLRHVSMLPRVALVDPELAMGTPAAITATTGFDALTQLIEPYVSSKRTPMVDALAEAGIPRAASSLRAAVVSDDLEARANMALAALWSGMALSNAGLGAVHGFAGPLGGLIGAPHGALCASLLPHVMTINIAALRRAGHEELVTRYRKVARLVTGIRTAEAEDGVRWVEDLSSELGIPRLRELGLTDEGIPDAIDAAVRASSMKGNPVVLGRDELRAVLDLAM